MIGDVRSRTGSRSAGRWRHDARESGGSIQIGSVNPSPAAVRVWIRDTGAGMDRPMVAQLFMPVEPQDAHGGQIWGASEGPGRGSAFEIELPALERAVETDDERRAAMKTGVTQRKKSVRGNQEVPRRVEFPASRSEEQSQAARSRFELLELGRRRRRDRHRILILKRLERRVEPARVSERAPDEIADQGHA